MTPVNPTEAHVRHFTERLLREHGLSDWKVVFDTAKRRAGQCRYSLKTISLSRPLIKARPVEESLNTARHEVAHALTGHAHGHDAVWRKKFIELGGNGARCFDASKVDREQLAKYVAVCPRNPEHKYYRHRAADSRGRVCAKCPGQQILTFTEIATGKPMVARPHRAKPKPRTVAIRLADGRVFHVPSRF